MSKSKATKRALIFSAVSMILCCAMLVGTTYAWFTDTVTSAGNVIKSGTLDADLVGADKTTSLEGQTISFKKADGAPAGEEVLWEPGCTYNLETVYVKNKGNLAFKYKIIVTGIDGDQKLLEAIDWSITEPVAGTTYDLNKWYHLLPGEVSPAIMLSGHMREEAGNEYQGLEAEGISIMIYAVQDTVEYDSFDNQYDAMGEVPLAAVSDIDPLRAQPIYNVFNLGQEIVGATLDTAYKFTATDNGAESKYKDWHADFVVYADKAVPADSVVLAGLYDRPGYPQYSGAWLGAVNTGTEIAANTPIRLLKDLGGVGVSYEEVCEFRNFYCGVGDMTDSNTGTTLTVELRLYEATGGELSTETGEYIVVGTTTYTFN